MILKAPSENIIPMLGNKLLPVIEMLSIRKWSDSDIADDLTFIRDELSKRVADLSYLHNANFNIRTFDEYSSEIRSGKLEWSPPHLSENFWKTNAAKLDNNQNEIVK